MIIKDSDGPGHYSETTFALMHDLDQRRKQEAKEAEMCLEGYGTDAGASRSAGLNTVRTLSGFVNAEAQSATRAWRLWHASVQPEASLLVVVHSMSSRCPWLQKVKGNSARKGQCYIHVLS